jgi:hypothetical protein
MTPASGLWIIPIMVFGWIVGLVLFDFIIGFLVNRRYRQKIRKIREERRLK